MFFRHRVNFILLAIYAFIYVFSGFFHSDVGILMEVQEGHERKIIRVDQLQNEERTFKKLAEERFAAKQVEVEEVDRDLLAAQDDNLSTEQRLEARKKYVEKKNKEFESEYGFKVVRSFQTWWGALRGMFVHASIAQLLFNMLFLWFFGNAVSATTGSFFYLFGYLFVGLCGIIFQKVFLDSPVVGSSVAINGVVGLLLVLNPKNRIDFRLGSRWNFVIPVAWVMGVWFFGDLYNTFHLTGNFKTWGLAYLTHVEGFIGGLALGFVSLKLKWISTTELNNAKHHTARRDRLSRQLSNADPNLTIVDMGTTEATDNLEPIELVPEEHVIDSESEEVIELVPLNEESEGLQESEEDFFENAIATMDPDKTIAQVRSNKKSSSSVELPRLLDQFLDESAFDLAAATFRELSKKFPSFEFSEKQLQKLAAGLHADSLEPELLIEVAHRLSHCELSVLERRAWLEIAREAADTQLHNAKLAEKIYRYARSLK